MITLRVLILFALSLWATTSTKQVISLSEAKSIILQADQIYQQILPQFFQMYQAPQLTPFNTSQPSPIPLCRISQIKPSEFITNSASFHYRLADPENFFLGNKKVANFSDLARLQGIVDVVEFGGQVVTLFQNGYYSLSKVDASGKIAKTQVKLLYDKNEKIDESNFGKEVFKTAVNYGILIKSSTNPEFLIFIGEDKALMMNKTSKVFEDLTGYEVLGMDFENAIMVENKVYAAMGFGGVHVYEVDFGKKSIMQINKFTPTIYNADSPMALQVIDLAWDFVTNQLILSDLQQGLHWLPIPSKPPTTTTLTYSLFFQNCQNLHINHQQKVLVATCPELLIVNLTDKKHQVIDEIEFDAQSLIVNESRIMIFGEYRYAVYDMGEDLVQKGESQNKVNFAAIVGEWVVVVNVLSISTGEIHPQQQKIMCHAASSQQMIGYYSANLTIEGTCSQLYQMPMLCKTNSTSIFYPNDEQLQKILSHQEQQQNCLLVYTINVQVRNSSQVSYWWQVVAAGVILWVLCSGMIIYCVKDVKVRKEYEELREEVATGRDRVMDEKTNGQLFEKGK